MSPTNWKHSLAVSLVDRALAKAFPGDFFLLGQSPLPTDSSDPEPDATIVRGQGREYANHPSLRELVVEVADSSLRYDRRVKLPLYARAGIGEVWIVDLRRLVVDVHRTPAGDGYATVEAHGPEDTVTLALAPEIAVQLRRVFA